MVGVLNFVRLDSPTASVPVASFQNDTGVSLRTVLS